MRFSLRQPLLADTNELAALHVECWKQTYSELLPAGFFDDAHSQQRVKQWQQILSDSNPNFHVSVAHDEQNKLVGFAFAAPCTMDEHDVPEGVKRQLYNLYVLNDHHGVGVGQQLLDSVLSNQPAMLWVAERNPRAIAFYRRNGFVFDGPVVQDPAAPLITDARMVRTPNPV